MNNRVYVVVDEKSQKFRGVYPSLDVASAASVHLITGEDNPVLILSFEMYDDNLKNKVVTVEEILNGKNKH